MAKAHRFSDEDIDWSKTNWEGARREQIKRWAALPLQEQLQAAEELEKQVKKSAHVVAPDWRGINAYRFFATCSVGK